MKNTHLTLLYLLTIILGCKSKTENIDFEKNVLIEIIPSIVDSTCHDLRLFLSPPPYPLFPPAGAEISKKEKIRLTKLWQLKRDSIKKDTSSLYLAFNPSIKKSTDSLENKLAKFTNKKIIPINAAETVALNINSIKLNQHFKFRHDSLFSKKLDVWNKHYDFIFSGFFYVSRIVFDESRSNGILSVGYTCGGLCGQGYIIYIKKYGKKWVIAKIEDTWIS